MASANRYSDAVDGNARRPERLFLGVPISESARRAISASLPKILPGKPVVPENWHFTLRFLGATDEERREILIRQMSAALLGSSFRVAFGELGAFPNARRARILWLGVEDGSERFRTLAKVVEKVVTAVGFAPEKRDFTPHLTLSRVDPPTSVTSLVASGIRIRERPDRVQRMKSEEGTHGPDRCEMDVDSIVLYRSVPGGAAPRYEELARFPLGIERISRIEASFP
jgi:2'-5' RNA ligase